MTIRLNSTALNVLRVFATLLVFVCHSYIVGRDEFGFELHGAMWLLKTPAWGGVWMFFAMGGFLAAYGFDRKSYTTDNEGISKYYKTRFIKVLLPTWIFISLAYMFSMNESTLTWRSIIQFLTCTFNGGGVEGFKGIGATWYVFISMWLYLLTPVLYRLLVNFEKKHTKKECKSYAALIAVIICVSVIYRGGGVYLGIDYYNWMYANVLGSIDLWMIGMIGCRLMHFLPTNVSPQKIKKLKTLGVITLLLLATVFSGWIKDLGSEIFPLVQTGLNQVYKIGPIFFGITAISLVILYSYRDDEEKHKTAWAKRTIASVCNAIAPYTFMFYLWHSGLLTEVANKLTIEDNTSHYWAMLSVGFIITSYVAYLMTKMNNGVIEHILNKQ